MQANRFGNGIESKTKKETEANEKRYLLPMQRASIERSNNIYERYKAGEEWLMSEGGDDLAKGFVNNFRSYGKVGDHIGKSNPVDEVLYGSNGVIRKVDSNKIKAYNGKSWYENITSQIPKMVDQSFPQSHIASKEYEFHNELLNEARNVMVDSKTGSAINRKFGIVDFERQITEAMKRKGITREEAIRDIYKSGIRK
ncbi:MAG: hypothetical protein IJ306_07150 [Oscillospiraceae bacterium]|nr:hypothetical protein [Oscillospiraceae bacterium]